MAESTVNSIVAAALMKAGVPEQNIELAPEPEPSELASKESRRNLDGSFKGQVKGQDWASEEEPAGPEPSEVVSGVESEHPLTKAEIGTAINQASSRFQSIMDKRLNTLQHQMYGTMATLNQFLQNRENMDIAALSPEEQVSKRLERLESGMGNVVSAMTRPQPAIEQQPVQFYQQLVNFVDAVGLKVDDQRIDWAPDVSNPQVGFNRFLTSLKNTLMEDQTKAFQKLRSDGNHEIQKIRKKTGVDKVSTSGPSGAGLPNIDKMTPLEKIQLGFQINEQLNQGGK